MKFNFNSELSKDKGVLLFLCVKNEPFHRYLTGLDKKNRYVTFYTSFGLTRDSSRIGIGFVRMSRLL